VRRLAAALALSACAALAQTEPTPFWLPPPPTPPPPTTTTEKKEQPKKKKPKPPAQKPKPAERAQKPAPPPAPAKKPQAPTWIEAPPPAVVTPAPRPAPAPAPAPVSRPAPPPVVVAPAPPPIAAPPVAEPPAPVIADQQEPEPVEAPPSDIRAWSFDVLAGGWAKARSDGSGRAWDLAYGVRGSRGLFDDAIEIELQLARAGGSSGSPFVSTTATHTLGMLRGFWVLGDRFALLLGGGAGVALAQTQYTLQDVVSGNVSSLSATAIKPVIGITGAGRVRVFRGLEARVEVSGMLRDGRVEYMPLFGLGWAL